VHLVLALGFLALVAGLAAISSHKKTAAKEKWNTTRPAARRNDAAVPDELPSAAEAAATIG